MKPLLKKTIKYGIISGLSFLLVGLITLFILYIVITPKLPSAETLKDVRLQVPLRVFTKQGELIAEFGEVKRQPLQYQEFPALLIQSILAAEDDRFFIHHGVDYKGILRAAFKVLTTGERSQGGSTITMQVARNFFLTREKTYTRKLNEIFLALKIEQELNKKEILTLYLNKIYLGKRSYGFAAASQVYYGKPLAELSLAQIAMLAGLPKAPSRYNPIANPQRATLRRNYILRRMYEDLDIINETDYQHAFNSIDDAVVHGQSIQVHARYVAEMVRKQMVQQYGQQSYVAGYSVYTTIDGNLQKAANQSLRRALLAYDRRHGYRGVEGHIELFDTDDNTEQFASWQQALTELSAVGAMQPALVFAVYEKEAYAYSREGNVLYLPWQQLEWARRYINDDSRGPELTTAAEILKPGDLIYTYPAKKGCSWLAKTPTVAGALVSLAPNDGAVQSLVGGFNYYQSKFNRVVQAKRQPGSAFKPFVYTAALDKGFTAATVINDAPVVFDAPGLEDTWRPENYSGRIYGPTRLRQALIKSRNLVSIRLLRDIGIGYTSRYMKRFSFVGSSVPRDLSLALGSGTLTPLQLARGYAVFANGGFKIEPYFIDYIRGPGRDIMMSSKPQTVCKDCEVEEEITDENVTHNPITELLDTDIVEQADALIEKDNAVIVEEQQPLDESQGELEVGQSQQTKSDSPQSLLPEVSDTQQPDTTATTATIPAIEFDYSDLSQQQINEGPENINLAKRVISRQTSFLVNTMLRDVIRFGTGRRARVIGRKDLSGKTGTTNDQQDAWFAGFNGNVVTVSWVGFDDPKPLGNRETGSRAALPIWIDYMSFALRGQPETILEQPSGLVSIRIDAKTGLPATINSEQTLFEYFREDHAPSPDSVEQKQDGSSSSQPSDITEEIF